MKETDFNLALKNDFNGVFALLVYGQDRGLVLNYYDRVSQHFNKSGDGFCFVDYNADDICKNPENFYADCVSDSFFGDKKLIRIKDVPDNKKFLTILEDLLSKPISSFLLLTSENLMKSSVLRKFFEKNNFCESIICYQDSKKDINLIISDFFFKNGKICEPDAREFIASHLGENRANTMSELEKLYLYVGDKKSITYKDAVASLSFREAIEVDDFIYGILEGDMNLFLKAYDKFSSEGIDNIALIHRMISHLKMVYQMRAVFDQNKNVSEAVKKINPRVFWKNESHFQNHTRRFDIKSILVLLEELYKCEKNLKSSTYYGIGEVYAQRFFLTLAQFCKKKV